MADGEGLGLAASSSTDLLTQGVSQASHADARAEKFLLVEGFLDRELCASLIGEARASEYRQSQVFYSFNEETEPVIDTAKRDVKEVKVSKETRALIAERLMTFKPSLEAHFDVQLTGHEKPNFLYYTVGGLYVAHTDSSDEPGCPDVVRNRQLSVIIFLNDQADSDDAEGYQGGSLVVYTPDYGLDSQDPGDRIAGKAGTLVAFRSNVFHEIQPLTSGERFSIITWFS
ncbi:MAG TPA: 2OG-Fe(II) oxygenase [Pyrinomonadaceae bacterium]|nr:2OG-Fe(II) oxygenase [Pyrinomonadaceae bacterium]